MGDLRHHGDALENFPLGREIGERGRIELLAELGSGLIDFGGKQFVYSVAQSRRSGMNPCSTGQFM